MNDIISRKKAHLDICINSDVESNKSFFSSIFLSHYSLPELDYEAIDTSSEFLGQKIRYPIFISCMTGGSEEAYSMNKKFAKVAEEFGIPVGLGSIRVLLENPRLLAEFQLKKIAPSVPLLANLGAVQLLDMKNTTVLDSVLSELQADALVFHLNPAQELCQRHGARNFQGIQEALREYIAKSTVPVIVKETGMGLHPSEMQYLLGIGARYVDIAGAGGSNWAKIELMNNAQGYHYQQEQAFASYDHWGHPSVLLLLLSYGMEGRLASGGIRNARDVLISLVLGSKAVGIALPIVRAAAKSIEVLREYISMLTQQLKQFMLLSKARNVKEVSALPFWMNADLQFALLSYSRAMGLVLPEKVNKQVLRSNTTWN
ncbi:isopentenyl-diphosphate delta-isomerase-like [Ylistrum balloti]|uniref:isopentenyl-diphosphate delta-isomerase-like n=1 Tax=Ylistrum balloti TaxID=509963 RepID=UPI0029059039|nr:isopentenyl-diphosphate delta-isomerase-like [Ylistrum balloti]